MISEINSEHLETLSAEALIDELLTPENKSGACITCSFQAEDMIVLHLLLQRVPNIPVLFLETGYHFAETYEYRDKLAKEWNLNLVNLAAQISVKEQESQFGILNQTDPTRCCQIRKVEPLMKGLEPYELWFTGLRREQSPSRKNLKKVEHHRVPSGKTLLKISALADWDWKKVWQYTVANNIPYLPLYDQGYLSVGCQPCTAIPDDPENARSGRWGGKKLECGIHTFSERAE